MKKSIIKSGLNSVFVGIIFSIFAEACSVALVYGEGFLINPELDILITVICAQSVFNIVALIFIFRGLFKARNKCAHFKYALVIYVVSFVLQISVNFMQVMGSSIVLYIIAFVIGSILEAFSLVFVALGIADLCKETKDSQKYTNKFLTIATIVALMYCLSYSLQLSITVYFNELYTYEESMIASVLSLAFILIALIWFAVGLKQASKTIKD